MAVKTSELVNFLKTKTVSAGILDRLKINYRPYICPFQDLLELIKPGASVLDIGCGSGQFLTLVAEFTAAKQLAGLEINPKLVQQARELLAPYQQKKTVKIVQFDGMHFPGFLTDSDTVFLIDVLHHVPVAKQEAFMQHLYAGLKPGTTLILKDIDAASPWVYFNKLHDLVLSKEIGHERSVAAAKKLVTEAGFKFVFLSTKQMFGYPHYTLVLEK